MVETHTFLPRVQPLYPGTRMPQAEPDEWAPRTVEVYVCPKGHDFEVPISDEIEEAEVPLVWRCRLHGLDGTRRGHEDEVPPPAPYQDRRRDTDGRTHYDRVLERRTRAELGVLLDERLAMLARARDPDDAPVTGQ